ELRMDDRSVPPQFAEAGFQPDGDVQQVAVTDRMLDRAGVAERTNVGRELNDGLAEREVHPQALDGRLARRDGLELAPAHALPDGDGVRVGDRSTAVDVTRLDGADADDVGTEVARSCLQVLRRLLRRGELPALRRHVAG